MPRRLAASIWLAVAAPAFASTWESAPALPHPEPRLGAVAVRDGTTVYVIGGSPFTANHDAQVHVLEDGAGAWTATTVVEGPIVGQGAGIDALGRIVVFGGHDGLDPEGDLGKAYTYDTEQGQQNDIAQRSALAAVEHFAWCTDAQGRIYSIGGGPGECCDPGGPNTTHVERYDGTTDTWTALAPLPVAVARAAAVEDGTGRVLVIGGVDATNASRRAGVLVYDIAAGAWSSGAIDDLPEPRSDARAVLGADDRVYLVGGTTGPLPGGAPSSDVLVLDVGAGTWTAAPSLSTPRSACALVLGADDHLYAVGGDDGAGGSNTVERLYTPPCPVFTTPPADTTSWAGQSATLGATVTGGTPLSFQWRRDGEDIVDGPAPGGGTFSGAQTDTLLIVGAQPEASGAYDVVASNPCGATVSAAAELTVQPPTPRPTAWSVTNLHPSWALSSYADGVTATRVVGRGTMNVPPYNNLDRPVVWTDGVALDVTPPGSVGGACRAGAGDVQVGWWWWPYTCYISGQSQTCYSKQACAWSGTSGSYVNLQVSGYEYSTVADTDGTVHVGTASTDDASGNYYSRAGMWVEPNPYFMNLHPAAIASNSGCTALDGDHQFGTFNTPYPGPVTHAAMWSGSAASVVDLHPVGAARSAVIGAGDGQQVGWAEFGALHASLWAFSAVSFLDLNPIGATTSSLEDCAGGLQVGSAAVDGTTRAGVWAGTPESFQDLHAALPPDFASSYATAIHVRADGAIRIAGRGYNTATGRTEALLWEGAPVAPADLDGNGSVDVGDLVALILAWGPCPPGPCPADLDGSGSVDVADLVALILAWS